MYRHYAPSNTSLSDDGDDDEPGKSTFFVGNDSHLLPLAPVSAHWSSKAPALLSPLPLNDSPISRVPPEILINIFKHVNAPQDLLFCTRVSRLWCQCAIELLWHKPTFPKYGTMVKMGHILTQREQTFTYARFIRRLNLLNLAQFLKDEVLFHFLHCDRLERLTLVNCKGVSGELLMHFLARFENLIAIDLTNCSQVTNSALVGLAHTARRLQGINLAGCARVTDTGLLALAQQCTLLRRVKLSGVSAVTDEAVITLAKSCPLLLEIDLNLCSKVTDIGVRSLWLHSAHMREMRLSHCHELTDNAFPAPPRIAQRVLPDFNPFSPANKAGPSTSLPPLVLDRSFEHIRMLDLTACARITDDTIEGIIAQAPKIRNLVLSKCALLTDRAVEAISKLGRCLHYLHLGHANKITDRSIRTLARSCTRLRYIDFANCTLLTDMSVFELSALPKLRRVGLVRVNNLTDEAIYALAERHATLERIHLSYCDQITVMAIHFLLQKLHKLTHLSLTGIPAFRNPELQAFCREAPQDFNTAQRLAFCVFSGKGISQLRNFLTEQFDSMNENGTDDTEYEDDFDEQFIEDGTPEPDVEVADGDRPSFTLSASPGNVTVQQGGRAGPSQPQAHEFMFNRDRSPRAVTIPTSAAAAGRQGNNVSPSVNILGATSRLNAEIQDGTAIPVAGPSRRGRQNMEGIQTITDMLPIIETPSGSSQGQNPHAQASMEPIYSMNEHSHSQRSGMDLDTPATHGVSLVDMRSNTQAGVYPRTEGNQWNMRRTLRDVFHFGRNPQEIPQPSFANPSSGSNSTRS
ncbi:hypothetical protein AGABI1DRAFT_120086 [Agaricus bisporus var. burnettii JB137-S8]|uniref:Uncharacterized protein n=1 Tax=Agaricus bisporus var. burnettii (strain JB137-S8 / ATCC MYA-4627 / FGSC 10392) TaxID=597362 RepID=K5XXM1_AGABU|nr:uncharacterized protein AGABI1DRAFT_120086 [Agaricus bisporus var. burnettii JB137-S8]EKM80050.1 hypothetical protein AGABI1DRAFT_120086 [Agaricus bisporus var. burnettii JB137-S8]